MTIAHVICKRCGINLYGALQVKKLEAHDGLCNTCRGFPVGLDAVKRKHEKCSYCGKEVWQH